MESKFDTKTLNRMAKKTKFESVTKTPEFLKKTSKAKGVSLAKDNDGYFVYTHRWSSKRYKTINAIPRSIIEFCESTG